PAVNDLDDNGIADALDAVEDLVAAAEAAYAAADQALADAVVDGAISQAEVDALTIARNEALADKAAAQAAVTNVIADYPTEAAGFQTRLDNLTDIVIPAV
ncbi:hypothetical protein M5F00_15930, partial [Acinetobacter sp. ANC 4945]